jgi:hypothetical protein
MGDGLDYVFGKFFKARTENLFDRFDGLYRAIVEETNDPLRIGRIRVRIPELHNNDVKRDELPWASPAFPIGGKGNGWWAVPMIGDVVFIQFEKNHPYAPIWVGAASPTRRKFYPLQSVHGVTPLAVNEKGESAGSPDDFDKNYLPKDERPMSFGVRDRYGTFFTISSVGFFPKEHAKEAASAGTDAVAKSAFKAASQSPEHNDPDVKYAVLHTKYGHTMILSDVGYEWNNEFKGDHSSDESFEIARHKYLLKFFNEGEPKGRDQRRVEIRTRYGHKIEMRDVGWSKNRPGEYDKAIDVSKESERDERWIKLRTKGGHVIQSIDRGNDAQKDIQIKQLLKTDKGADLDGENEEGFKEDARQIRLVSRHGNKIAIDDRGSDKTDATAKDGPRGNGILMKTRRGFVLDANDKDPANRMMLLTPDSKVIDLNDRLGYVMVSTDTANKITEDFKGTKDNEFSRTVALTHDPERTSFHAKFDNVNKYISVKTPEGQGIEMRDADAPCASFTETTGPDDRGMWMSRDHNRAVWRSKDNNMYIALDDGQQLILIRNNNKKVQIFAQSDVEIIAQENISLKAGKSISLKAGSDICMEAAGTHWTVQAGHVGTNQEIRGRRLNVVSMFGTHEVIQIPCDPCGPAPAGVATECVAHDPKSIDVTPRKPLPFNIERNCAPNKSQAKPVSSTVFSGGSGGFGMPPSSSPPPPPPPPSPFAPSKEPDVVVNPSQQPVDPLESSDGVLFYGTSTKFQNEIASIGLALDSFANNNNEPPKKDADKLTLSINLEDAADAAALSQKRYGSKSIIYRVLTVSDASLLTYKADVAEYRGSIKSESIEILDIGPEFVGTPKFPNI